MRAVLARFSAENASSAWPIRVVLGIVYLFLVFQCSQYLLMCSTFYLMLKNESSHSNKTYVINVEYN